MLALIALLLAAILITLPGVWEKGPGCFAGILRFILFCMGGIHGAYISEIWAIAIWLGLPFGALLGFGIDEMAQGRRHRWVRQLQPSALTDSPYDLNVPVFSVRSWCHTVLGGGPQ
ncbi:hypothetical protein NKDENANG_03269 [Candidatus Entotheonellaceae bacterium PAL068K]